MGTYERCKNCNKLFKPMIDSKYKEFCQDKCKQEYNKKKNISIVKPIRK